MMCAKNLLTRYSISKYISIYIKMTKIPKSNTLLIKITIIYNFPIYKLYILAAMWFLNSDK